MCISTPSSGPEGPDWLGLRWSTWMPLTAAHPLALAQLPSAPGVYRVRRADTSGELLWIGWAYRGIREAVERLSRQVHMPIPPYDDPTSPALILWKARLNTTGYGVSGAAVDPTTEGGERVAREIEQRVPFEAPLQRRVR